VAGSNQDSPVVWPSIRCGDTRALIDFLVAAFGFEEQFSVPGEDGKGIIHAQIRWPGGGGVMLGDAEGGDAFHLSLPFGPVSIYVVTDQPDALHDRAVAVGATIVRGLRDEDYGSRGFSATDPEGNLWSFGTYAG
jgi:uncharacterized glyoxalase superfamily protein PhnB